MFKKLRCVVTSVVIKFKLLIVCYDRKKKNIRYLYLKRTKMLKTRFV